MAICKTFLHNDCDISYNNETTIREMVLKDTKKEDSGLMSINR